MRFSGTVKTLSNLRKGENGKIIQVRGKPDVHRYLCGIGLAVGRYISIDGADPESHDSPVRIKSGNIVATIEKEIAGNIRVLVVS